jgi:hypothetical protein
MCAFIVIGVFAWIVGSIFGPLAGVVTFFGTYLCLMIAASSGNPTKGRT